MVQPFILTRFKRLLHCFVFSSKTMEELNADLILERKQAALIKSSLPKNALLFILSLITFFSSAGQEHIINDSVAKITEEVYRSLDIVSLNSQNIPFKKIPDRRINERFTGDEFYFYILKLSARETLANQSISIDNTSLDTIIISSLSSGKAPLKLYEGGRFIPYDQERSFVWHTAPIEIGTKSHYYLLAVKASQKTINFQFELLDDHQLSRKYQEFNRLVFFYAGIAFIISSIILLAYFLFKKKVFIVYAGYMACVTFWILDHYGIIFPYLYPNAPIINHLSKPLSSLGAAFLLLTTQKLIFYTHLRSYPVLQRLVNYLRYFIAALIVASVLLIIPKLNSIIEEAFVALWHAGLIFSIILISFIPLYFIKKSEIAKIFSLAMIVICLTTLYQLVGNIAILHSHFLNEHAMALGSALENSIMAFGLLYGLMLEKRNQNLQVVALQAEQKEMLKKLIYVQVNERKRVAEDLHDNIGPLLAALKINFRRIINMNGKETRDELIQKTEKIIDDSIVEIRNVAHNLMPKKLESNGLINSLEDYFRDVQQLYGKQLTFTHEVYVLFKPEIQANIYFIISELVLNAAKHSNAKLIDVSVKTELQAVSIKVLDNGQGFPVKQMMNHHSFGIQSAESRTNYLNGKFSLTSSAGKGTAVNIQIPL